MLTHIRGAWKTVPFKHVTRLLEQKLESIHVKQKKLLDGMLQSEFPFPAFATLTAAEYLHRRS